MSRTFRRCHNPACARGHDRVLHRKLRDVVIHKKQMRDASRKVVKTETSRAIRRKNEYAVRFGFEPDVRRNMKIGVLW